MEWTIGNMLFYGGIAGMVITFIIAIITIIALKISKKSIVRKLNDEYGGEIK